MKRRVLFYSHDTFGLGHFRRSLTVASHLVRHVGDLSALMLTGLDSAAAFEPVSGVDFVKLPGVWKSGREEYRSRHLKVSFARVRRIRRELIRGVARAYDPHLVVVDHAPRGAGGELLSVLRWLRERRPATRIALVMRDVLDDPAHVIANWRELGMEAILERFYDEIWVAGPQAVFDPAAMYGLPETIRQRMRYCGYVVRATTADDAARLREDLALDERPRVLVSCGGGGDGEALVGAWTGVAGRLAADGIGSLVLLGPDMPAAARRAARDVLRPLGPMATVLDFCADVPGLLSLSAASVSMAGYNTTCEVLASGRPALLVPREAPRAEQKMRAEALARLGLARLLLPSQLTPERLESDVRALLAQPVRAALPDSIDFAGCTRIARRARKHLDAATTAGGE